MDHPASQRDLARGASVRLSPPAVDGCFALRAIAGRGRGWMNDVTGEGNDDDGDRAGGSRRGCPRTGGARITVVEEQVDVFDDDPVPGR